MIQIHSRIAKLGQKQSRENFKEKTGTDLGVGISEERMKSCRFLGNRLITSIKGKSART